MTTLQVFDPPMCCSTGVCGPSVDPELARFAADLEWLSSRGVTIERHTLSQEPEAFISQPTVKTALDERGDSCLPLVLCGSSIVSEGSYPSREQLSAWVGLAEPSASLYSPAVAELVALGAAVASGCEPCFKHHYDQARKLGVSRDDMSRAVSTAQAVKETPARHMQELAERYLSKRGATRLTDRADADNAAPAESSGCCGPSTAAPAKTEVEPETSGCCGPSPSPGPGPGPGKSAGCC